MRHRQAALALFAMTLATTGCEDGGPLGPEGTRQATFTLAVPAAPAGFLGAAVPVTDRDGRSLDLTRVQLLLRSAELKLQTDDGCVGDDDDCEKFVTGATLVDLPVAGGVVTPFSTPIRPGVYDELEIRIKEPDDDNGDRARFQAAHPDWPRKATVRVRGTYDAGDGAGPQPFDAFVEVDAEIERQLAPPLVVDATTAPGVVNVTLSVDIAAWFRASGGRLVDPRRLAGDDELAELVEENIEESLEAFRDDDRDGRDEGDDDDASGDDDDADDDDGTAEAEGTVQSVSVGNGTFTLQGGRMIRLTSTTVIDAEGDLTTLQAVADAVSAGRAVRAEAHGTLVSESGAQVLVASRVKFETDEDDGDDDDGTAEAEGAVSSASAAQGTFTLQGGRVVRLTSTTAIDAEGDLTSLQAVEAALAAGRAVRAEARGTLVTEGGSQVLVAATVKFETDEDDGDDDGDGDDGAAEAEGEVSSVSVGDGTFTLAGGRVVRLTSTTTIEADGDLRSLQAVADALAAGRKVEAEAKGRMITVGGTQVLEASRVKFEIDDD